MKKSLGKVMKAIITGIIICWLLLISHVAVGECAVILHDQPGQTQTPARLRIIMI